MKNLLEQIEITAGRDGLEEVAAHDLDPFGQAGMGDRTLRLFHSLLSVEQNPFRGRVLPQQPQEQAALTASDIDRQLERLKTMIGERMVLSSISPMVLVILFP